MKRLVLLLPVVLAAAGCSTAPQSYIQDRYVIERTVINRFPIRVVAIDGKLPDRTPVSISPGQHLVTFDAAPPPHVGIPVQKTYPMTILPCTTYWVAGQRENRLQSDWSLVLEETEPVGGCNPDTEMARVRAETAATPPPGAVSVASGR